MTGAKLSRGILAAMKGEPELSLGPTKHVQDTHFLKRWNKVLHGKGELWGNCGLSVIAKYVHLIRDVHQIWLKSEVNWAILDQCGYMPACSRLPSESYQYWSWILLSEIYNSQRPLEGLTIVFLISFWWMCPGQGWDTKEWGWLTSFWHFMRVYSIIVLWGETRIGLFFQCCFHCKSLKLVFNYSAHVNPVSLRNLADFMPQVISLLNSIFMKIAPTHLWFLNLSLALGSESKWTNC